MRTVTWTRQSRPDGLYVLRQERVTNGRWLTVEEIGPLVPAEATDVLDAVVTAELRSRRSRAI